MYKFIETTPEYYSLNTSNDLTFLNYKLIKDEPEVAQHIKEVISECYAYTRNMSRQDFTKVKSSDLVLNNHEEIAEDIIYYAKNANSGNMYLRISPVVINDFIYTSKLHLSILYWNNRLMLINHKIGAEYIRKKSANKLYFSTRTNYLWPSSKPAYTTDSNSVSKREIFYAFFKDIAWLSQDNINKLAMSQSVQIIECKNNIPIIIADSRNFIDTPEEIYTPVGVFSCSDVSSWPSSDNSIRDFFVKTLGKDWKINLRNKRIKNIFGKNIKDIDWYDQEFLDVFLSAAIAGGNNIT